MGVIAASVSIVSVAHFVTPPGVHTYHWVHIFLQKLFYLPILMAAEAHRETIAALASSLDLRERETALHSKRVQEYALFLARRVGIKEGDILEGLEMGALLHDVGKIGVPDGILLKKGGLTEEERDVIRCHPDLGASLLHRIPFLSGAREIVESHHEKFDGSGYPKGLKGEQIPIGARIFAVADVFDALTTDRPYKAALSYRSAVDSLANDRGTHFDPDVVDVFLKIPFRALAEIASRNGVVLIRP